jgi:diguanylate cyclase (GGDEF)-like protein
MRRIDLLTTAATLSLSAVLVFSTVFGFYAASATQRASDVAHEAQALNDSYQRAQNVIGLEESLRRKYRLEPGPLVAHSYTQAAALFVTELESVAALSSPARAAEVKRLLEEHGAYLAATRRMFAAVDAHDVARAIVLDHAVVDPAFSHIADVVSARAAEQHTAAVRALDDLNRTQRDVVRDAIDLSLLGVLCLGAFLFALSAYRRRTAETHRAEIRTLEEAVSIDALTKIGNHRSFKDDIKREVALATRYGGSLTLAMLDVDEFKLINDESGHERGDAVLVALATLLRSGRVGDRPYRIGGDEFALILPQTSGAEAHHLLERLRIASSRTLEGGTISIGHASLGWPDGNAETLQNQADAALYISKRGGRDGVSEYDSSFEGTWLLSPDRVHNMRALLSAGIMNTAFQAIWDLESKGIIGYEALARPPAHFGFAGPQDAFDLAERIGRVHELGALCRTAALSRAVDLPSDALLFLNISPQTLDRNLDVASLRAAVTAAGLTPERIVIEITERSVAHIDAVIESATALRRAGFQLALDDTGARHAGLEILSRVHFDFVKIDREIILKGMSDRNARGVVAAIVSFARVTGAYVIAEGIQDTAMLDFVDAAGRASERTGRGICGAQGYVLLRPSETFPRAAEVRDVQALLSEHITEESAHERAIADARPRTTPKRLQNIGTQVRVADDVG